MPEGAPYRHLPAKQTHPTASGANGHVACSTGMWHPTDCSGDAAGWRAVVVAEETPIMLAAIDGGWHAVEDRCTHAGCAFSTDGELDGATIVCDCHGSEFDIRTGEVLRMPARAPIRTFPTRVVDGMVEVEL